MPTAEGYQVMERAREYGTSLTNITINAVSSETDEVILYTLPRGEYRTPDEIVTMFEKLTELIPAAHITLTVGEIKFDRGQDLLDWVQKDKLNLDIEKEVRQ